MHKVTRTQIVLKIFFIIFIRSDFIVQSRSQQGAELIQWFILHKKATLMSIIFGRVHWAITKKKQKNIYHLLIFNKLLTSSEHRNRNKPFYIYKGLIQWKKADPASTPWPMYMHESNAIHIQKSSRADA
jgi:hypothetical protein